MNLNKTSDTYKVSDLVKLTGLGRETLRFYEKKGLLKVSRRTDSGYRLFSNDTVDRINFIKSAQAQGFTLREIVELLALQTSPNGTCGKMSTVLKGKSVEVKSQLDLLLRKQKFLDELVSQCSSMKSSAPCQLIKSKKSFTSCC